MADSLSDSVGKLRQSSARLNRLTDEAGATVKEVEDFLNDECSIGIPAHICVQSSPEPYEDSQYLEYRRFAGRFRIAVVWCPSAAPERETVKPWSDCARDEKLQTIGMLPDLLSEIAKNIDERIVEAEETMNSVSQVLQNLSGKGE